MQMYWEGQLEALYLRMKTFLRCDVQPLLSEENARNIYRYCFAEGESWCEDSADSIAKWQYRLKETGCEDVFLPDIDRDDRYRRVLRCVFPEKTTEWQFGYRANDDEAAYPGARGIYDYSERLLPCRATSPDTTDPTADFRTSAVALLRVLPEVRYDSYSLPESHFRERIQGILNEIDGVPQQTLPYETSKLAFGEPGHLRLYNATNRAWAFLGGYDSRNEGMPPDLLCKYDALLMELALQSTRARYYALNFWEPDEGV